MIAWPEDAVLGVEKKGLGQGQCRYRIRVM